MFFRWDFESQEEYAAYMDRKEALPKAAFQYGVKMAEGRRTKGAAGPQGQQIQGQKKVRTHSFTDFILQRWRTGYPTTITFVSSALLPENSKNEKNCFDLKLIKFSNIGFFFFLKLSLLPVY